MGYYIDLSKVTLDGYKAKLASAYLPPSRMILRDRLEERFGHFRRIGISTVKQLMDTLKKKDKFTELQKVECLSGSYLIILLRELNSMLPKPNKIGEFTGISRETAAKLDKAGIKNTVTLYTRIITAADRKELADTTRIPYAEILELTKLTDLSRIKWVGAATARMLYDSGTDTVRKVSDADPADLHARINQVNREKGCFKGQIGLNDIKILIHTAGEIPLEVKYGHDE